MAAVKWFSVNITAGDWRRTFYAYETHTHLFDLQFHWQYTSRLHDTLRDVLAEFSDNFQKTHNLAARNMRLTVGEPLEVDWETIVANRPQNKAASYFIGP